VNITQDQLRETAQIMYPQDWESDPMVALVKTVKLLDEASRNPDARPAITKAKDKDGAIRPTEINQLEEHLKANDIHVTAAAKAIGVHPVSLYAWFHGNSRPKSDNLARIRGFLAKTKA
jgi:hypothetical protein